MRHSIVLIRAALCQHSASSSPKEANMIDRLLWLFEKQLLNRHTMASNYLASIFRPFRHRGREREREKERERELGKFLIQVGNRGPPFHLEKIW